MLEAMEESGHALAILQFASSIPFAFIVWPKIKEGSDVETVLIKGSCEAILPSYGQKEIWDFKSHNTALDGGGVRFTLH